MGFHNKNHTSHGCGKGLFSLVFLALVLLVTFLLPYGIALYALKEEEACRETGMETIWAGMFATECATWCRLAYRFLGRGASCIDLVLSVLVA